MPTRCVERRSVSSTWHRGHPRGVQIGVVNYTRDPEARKIGLVNINPQTRIDVLPYVGSSTRLNLALRFRNAHTYTMFGVGSHFLGLDEDFSGELFYRMGRYWTIAPKWTLGGDLASDTWRLSRTKPIRREECILYKPA